MELNFLNIIKKIANLFKSDGIIYSSSGLSIDLDMLMKDEKSKEIESAIRSVWDEHVDENGYSRPRRRNCGVPLSVTWPQEGELWQHHSGRFYLVMCLANVGSEDPVQFPITVVYKGPNGRTWARPLVEFQKKFEPASYRSKEPSEEIIGFAGHSGTCRHCLGIVKMRRDMETAKLVPDSCRCLLCGQPYFVKPIEGETTDEMDLRFWQEKAEGQIGYR